MAKAGMRRPDPDNPRYKHGAKQNFPKNDQEPVPEIQGKEKTGNKKIGEP